jgi:hypothetical protein
LHPLNGEGPPLADIDWARVHAQTGLLPGEKAISGWDKYRRLEKLPEVVLLGPRSGRELLAEAGQKTLRALYKRFGASRFEMFGMFQDHEAYAKSLVLVRLDNGHWIEDYRLMENSRDATIPTLVMSMSA